MPDDKHEKYEDEIREILNRMDNFIPEGSQRSVPPRRPSPPPWSGWTTNLRRRLYGYNSTSFLVGWVLLALAAGLLHKIYSPFGALAALASVGCLLAAILLPMISREFGTPEHRWRGRTIDYQPARIRRPFSWRYTWWRIKSFFGFR
jgi:hypothetical protein